MPSMEELQKVLAKNKVTLQTEEDCLEVNDIIIACPQATRAVVLTDYQTLEWTVKTQLHIMNDMQAGGDVPNCDQVGNLPHKAECTDSEVKGE